MFRTESKLELTKLLTLSVKESEVVGVEEEGEVDCSTTAKKLITHAASRLIFIIVPGVLAIFVATDLSF